MKAREQAEVLADFFRELSECVDVDCKVARIIGKECNPDCRGKTWCKDPFHGPCNNPLHMKQLYDVEVKEQSWLVLEIREKSACNCGWLQGQHFHSKTCASDKWIGNIRFLSNKNWDIYQPVATGDKLTDLIRQCMDVCITSINGDSHMRTPQSPMRISVVVDGKPKT